MPDSLDYDESQESKLYKQLRQLKMYCDSDSDKMDSMEMEQNDKQNSSHQSEQFKVCDQSFFFSVGVFMQFQQLFTAENRR